MQPPLRLTQAGCAFVGYVDAQGWAAAPRFFVADRSPKMTAMCMKSTIVGDFAQRFGVARVAKRGRVPRGHRAGCTGRVSGAFSSSKPSSATPVRCCCRGTASAPPRYMRSQTPTAVFPAATLRHRPSTMDRGFKECSRRRS